jgi:hypothetical protein
MKLFHKSVHRLEDCKNFENIKVLFDVGIFICFSLVLNKLELNDMDLLQYYTIQYLIIVNRLLLCGISDHLTRLPYAKLIKITLGFVR